MSTRCISIALAALFASIATTQGQDFESRPVSADAFLARHDGAWRVVRDPVTGRPSFLYGGRLASAAAPRTEAEYELAARVVVDQNPELFSISSADLELVKVHSLRLSRIGSTDKVAVVFRQIADDVPVFGGAVTVLFDAASGDVIAIDNLSVPDARDAAAYPRSGMDEVLDAANRTFQAEFGFPFTEVQAVEAAIVAPSAFFGRKNPLTARGATLAYLVDVRAPGRLGPSDVPAQARVFVSAEGDLTVFKVQETAYAVDGNAKTNVNIGPEPNTPFNQELVNLENAYVRQGSASGAILATTDAAGNFSTGGAGPTTLAIEFEGPFCRANNWNAPDHVIVIQNATTPANFVLNPNLTEFDTAEAAAFVHVNAFRDYVKSVDPNDDTMDFQLLAHVNKNDLICNAYFDGGSINLQRSGTSSGGSQCANTSYQDVVQHEEGHFANELYINGGVTGAFHEGNADSFAYFINDDPCLTHFIGTGQCLRTALQTAIKKCPTDGDESCHGGAVHTEGQALASAHWAVRDRLNQTHGDAIGDAIADALFMGWMNVFNDGAILNVIEDHWLALDDDNGDLSDLTPNFADIDGGFKDYGWPGLPDLNATIVSAPADNAEVGHLQPVTVVAKITSIAGTVASAAIHYAPFGGAFSQVAMAPTGNPDEFSATIPGFPSPASIQWYLEATSSIGGQLVEPAGAPEFGRLFHVGTLVPLMSWDFEAANDQGWTHVNLSGQFGDQWERGTPANSNEATDPGSAFSGNNVWGTDLSLQGFDGKYEPNGSGELRSPAMSMIGQSQVFLQYRRWLNVEEGQFDQAQIFVNNTLVWQNPFSGHVLDDSWNLHVIDITQQAAGNPSVQIKWRLTSDGGLEFGGWNIDDVMLYRVDAAPGGFFAAYGQGCAGSSGTPALSGSGTPSPGLNVSLQIAGGLAGGSGVLLFGTAQAQIPVQGCDLLVSGLVGGGFALTLDAGGGLVLGGTIPASAGAGDVFLQFFGFDPGAPNGEFAASNGLQMHIQ